VVRILQEALANIRKHSGAQGARVALLREDGHIVLQVDDDGSGFDPARLPRGDFPRFGLSTMRERAESIGAAFKLDSTQGQGTRLRLEVPVTPSNGPRQKENPDARPGR
jgi:signal transduction histidine kinase